MPHTGSSIVMAILFIRCGLTVNTLRPKQNGRHFPDHIFKCISLNENVLISIKISLNFVPRGPINNIPALVQIMAWRQPGDMPLSEPMMVCLLTHICVTQPQWVNGTKWPTFYIQLFQMHFRESKFSYSFTLKFPEILVIRFLLMISQHRFM